MAGLKAAKKDIRPRGEPSHTAWLLVAEMQRRGLTLEMVGSRLRIAPAKDLTKSEKLVLWWYGHEIKKVLEAPPN